MFGKFAEKLLTVIIEAVTEEQFPEEVDFTDLERLYELVPVSAR
jgi:hypothetical protein